MGAYNPKLLQADEASVTYKDEVIPDKTMYDLIPTLGKATKYAGKFIVVDGELVYQGLDTNQQNWAKDIGTQVIIAGEPKVNILPPTETVVAIGTDVVYTIKFSSNVALTTVDLTDKLEALDSLGVALTTQPVITIGTVSGTSADTTRQVDITIKTDTLTYGGYKLRIKSGSIINSNNVSNSQDTVSLIGFDIADTVPPENPTMSANPTTWTNGNVIVTINYSGDSSVKEYSLDGTTWNTYTTPVVVTENNTTVYSRGKDNAGNESGVATLTVSNIDKVTPTVAYGTNGAGDIKTASTTVTVSDTGESAIKTSTLQYVWDTQNTTTPTSGWTAFTNGNTITKSGVTGTYYLWVKGSDNAGNSVTEKSNSFIIDNVAPANPTLSANPTAWTNGSVTVTITYPVDVVIKQYSTNGSTWITYTSPVDINSNLTVYARGSDASGNQSGQATLSITNIDKTAPTVAYGTNGSSSGTISTTVTVSDTGGSSLNTSTLQYVWDTQNVTTPTSGWATFTNGGTLTKTSSVGTYYLWIKASDNAGNNLVSKTNAFIVSTINLSYTGSVQTYTVPTTGTYKLEVWGAQGQGGTDGNSGGLGGYAYGRKYLTSGTVLYIYIGSQDGYNGGGSGNASNNGGGATHIATASGLLSSLSSNTSAVLIVGGGGGGTYGTAAGGVGGGLTGGNGYSLHGYSITGGTQTAGGVNGGTFGKGANQGAYQGTPYTGGGGGGGWYGGGSNNGTYVQNNSGAGGSSYITGLSSSGTTAGVQSGNGKVVITLM